MACEILLTDTEASDAVRMLRARLVRLARAGKVPCVLLPDGEVRFRRADLENWVAQHEQPANLQSATTQISNRAEPLGVETELSELGPLLILPRSRIGGEGTHG